MEMIVPFAFSTSNWPIPPMQISVLRISAHYVVQIVLSIKLVAALCLNSIFHWVNLHSFHLKTRVVVLLHLLRILKFNSKRMSIGDKTKKHMINSRNKPPLADEW